MRILFALLVASLVLVPRAITATVDQLLPWLAPNPLELGASYSAFVQAHPDAKNPLLEERSEDKAFNGEMFVGADSDTVMIYGFANGELTSIDWASSVNVHEATVRVRNALIRVHGQPTVETTARVDARGSIARIVREVYRPTTDKDYVICLLATSEGVEVDLTNEAMARKHGIKTSRLTYEEAARAVSAVIQPNEKPSEIVDYLAAERAKTEAPQPGASPKPPTPQPSTPSLPIPTATPPTATPLPSTPVARVAENPAPAVERKSPVWPWLVGLAALAVIALHVWKRRA